MKKAVGIILVILIIAALVLFFLFFTGKLAFPFGGSGSGSSGSSESSVSESAEDESETEPAASETEPVVTETEEVAYVEITVKDSEYIYQNKTMELDDLMVELNKLESGTVVRITDENASKNAFDALTEALTDARIAYETAE